MTKATTPIEISKRQSDNTKRHQNFRITTIVYRLRTVSLSNDSHRIVLKLRKVENNLRPMYVQRRQIISTCTQFQHTSLTPLSWRAKSYCSLPTSWIGERSSDSKIRVWYGVGRDTDLWEKEEIWLNHITKALTPTENSKKQSDNTKTPPKYSITQRLRTDLGRTVGVTTVTKLV